MLGWDFLLVLLTIIAIPIVYVLGLMIHAKYEDKKLKINTPLMIILLVALLVFLGLRFAEVL